MNRILFTILSITTLINACTQNYSPQEIFNEAYKTLSQASGLGYDQIALYQNPMGEFDTLKASLKFVKKGSDPIGYDFLLNTRNNHLVSKDGEFRFVSHEQKAVKFFTQTDSEQEERYIKNIPDIKYSPITLFSMSDWFFFRRYHDERQYIL